MRILLALAFVVAACSGPKKKGDSALVPEPATPDTCCCKSTPLTAEEVRPVYEVVGRMECSSTKKGTCVDDVQCNQADQPATPEPEPEPQDTGVPPPPEL
jgi:hypothetical protein